LRPILAELTRARCGAKGWRLARNDRDPGATSFGSGVMMAAERRMDAP
jgi:hypothetical protein